MPSSSHDPAILASGSYAVLRHEGIAPPAVRAALGLPDAAAARLERLFQARPGGGLDPMRPRFAQHTAHVRAVIAQGGYPALAERHR